ETEIIINKWAGEKMFLPMDNIELLSNSHEVLNSIDKIINKPLKIVTTIDGDCGECLNSLTYWQKFSDNLILQKIECPIVVYMKGEYKEDLKDILDKYKISIPCFFDSNAEFEN